MKFSERLKELRIARGLTLRECSQKVGVDPSNWSKLERGITPAPKDQSIIEGWAEALSFNYDERISLLDAAAISRGEIPNDLASDEKVLAALPVFFRVARN